MRDYSKIEPKDLVLEFNGITDPFDAEVILTKTESMPDASEYCDLDKFKEFVEGPGKKVLFADYDADGIMSAAIFRLYFPDIDVVIPERETGYSLTKSYIDSLTDCDKIVTVDCGISNKREIEYGQSLGIEFFVTDHHRPDKSKMPDCDIANPHLSNMDFRELCGSGVIYNILSDIYGPKDKALAYAAIGTVCDIVPMLGPNRYLVREGLKEISTGRHKEITELSKACKVFFTKITEEDIGWKIGPAINSAGRLGEARTAFDFFSGRIPDIEEAAKNLARLNKKRKKQTVELHEDMSVIAETSNGIVFAVSPEMTPSMTGLVAGRLSTEYNMPAIAISKNGEISNGSMRSPQWFRCHEMIKSCRSTLVTGGGHSSAAGFSVKTDMIDDFLECAFAYNDNLPIPESNDTIKYIKVGSKWAVQTIDEINEMRPFGYKFERPVFQSEVTLTDVRAVGKGAHLKALANGVDIICYGKGDMANQLDGKKVTIFYTANINNFFGRVEPQFEVTRIQT